jgi:DNA-binding NarL/FixJ family response regulator
MPMPMRTRTGAVARPDPRLDGTATSVAVLAPAGRRAALEAVLESDGLMPVNGSASAVVVVATRPAADDQAVRRARTSHPDEPIVLVARQATLAEARRLLVDDIAGFVLERDVDAALAATVRAVLAGQVSYPAELMPSRLHASLSTREKQILGMVVLGLSNAEIADKLFVSESTVKTHLSSAFATMGVRSRKEAISLILDPDAGFGTGILGITESA